MGKKPHYVFRKKHQIYKNKGTQKAENKKGKEIASKQRHLESKDLGITKITSRQSMSNKTKHDTLQLINFYIVNVILTNLMTKLEFGFPWEKMHATS